jgi:hypothetical protein
MEQSVFSIFSKLFAGFTGIGTQCNTVQSLCLLNRLCFLGEGAKAAAGKRDLAKRLETSRKRDLHAHHQAHIQGQGLSRAGLIFVP